MTLIDQFLSGLIRHGTLAVTDHRGKTLVYGTPAAGFPDVAIRFTDARVGRDIALRPDLGAGEAFMDGRLVIEGDDIMGLLTLVRRNSPWEERKGLAHRRWLSRFVNHVRGRLDHFNMRRRAKRNVAHHYDLDDRLYDLFLDENRQYSCGYFRDPGNDIDQAQRDKMAHIAAKLDLKPGMKVLDIGSGWGGLALYLHRQFGVDVLGVTLSEEQLRYARADAQRRGAADHVRFELCDYRDLAGQYDRIVSIGMFEHVGVPQYRTFFAKCHDLLAPDGVMLLHTIGRQGMPGATDAWTQKYIFPGAYAPSLSEITPASERARLIQTDCETWRLHYALTLRRWYERCVARRAEIEAVYDARFFRMWLFYLAGCTSAFEHGVLCVYQLQYARDRRALPITRDYMHEAEEIAAERPVMLQTG
jgi:cyclopropane-fatty-acyl-phospholipid synthase